MEDCGGRRLRRLNVPESELGTKTMNSGKLDQDTAGDATAMALVSED